MSAAITSCYSTPLTIVSWNIAEAAPSFAAPSRSRRVQEAPRLIRECILGRNQPPPDIIALQESPFPSFGTEPELFEEQGYFSVGGTTLSHCGYVDLLLKKELAEKATIHIEAHHIMEAYTQHF